MCPPLPYTENIAGFLPHLYMWADENFLGKKEDFPLTSMYNLGTIQPCHRDGLVWQRNQTMLRMSHNWPTTTPTSRSTGRSVVVHQPGIAAEAEQGNPMGREL